MNNAILKFIFKCLLISSSKILTCKSRVKLLFNEVNGFHILYTFQFKLMNWYRYITCCNVVLMSMSTKQFASNMTHHMSTRTPDLINTLLNKISTFLAICDNVNIVVEISKLSCYTYLIMNWCGSWPTGSVCCGSNGQIHMDYRNPMGKKGQHGHFLSERGW